MAEIKSTLETIFVILMLLALLLYLIGNCYAIYYCITNCKEEYKQLRYFTPIAILLALASIIEMILLVLWI
jgi:hypothetical protein